MSTIGFNAGAFADVDIERALIDPGYGIFDYDDFRRPADLTATYGKYIKTADGGSSTLSTSLVGGVYNLVTGATADYEVTLSREIAGEGLFKPTLQDGKRLMFCARAMLVNYSDMGYFIGMAEPGLTSDVLTDDTMVLDDKDYIGFHVDAAGPTAVDCVHNIASGTATVAEATAFTNDATEAAYFHAFGFVFDGGTKLTYYIDGTEVGETAVCTSTTFPTAQILTPIFCLKSYAGTSITLRLDWWFAFQEWDRSGRATN